MKPLVSVIVPVNNVEGYLRQCIDSLLAQTLKDIEIILIDDGSTDGSGRICEEYARADSRVRVIHKENEGLSAARNDGMEEAEADYIIFVDSDDWVEPGYCEIPYRIAIGNGCDLVLSDYNNYKNGRLTQRLNIAETNAGLVSKETAMELIHRGGPGINSWNKLCRKELLKDIRFPVGRLCEDAGTTYKWVHKADRIYYSKRYLYNYRDGRPGSIMNTYSEKLVTDRIELNCIKNTDLKNWGYGDRYEKEYAFGVIVRYGHIKGLTERCVPVVKGIKGYPDYFNRKQKIMLFVYRRSVVLFDFICTLTGRREK